MEQNKQTNDFGAMAGIIIVVIFLLVGAFYFGDQRIEQSKQFQASINEAVATTSTSSDEISDIEKDVNSIDVNSLGTGINNL
jgi:CHASE3 domain sensor protein